MNRTQIAIIACWAILTGITVCVVFEVSEYTPYAMLLFLFIRERFVDEKAFIKQYFSDRNKRTIALMAFCIAPFAWYLYRLFSAPNLPDNFGIEVLFSSIPLLTMFAIYDRWLYVRTARIANGYVITES